VDLSLLQHATVHCANGAFTYLSPLLQSFVTTTQPQNVKLQSLCFIAGTVLLILIYIQRDATLHNLFYLETALHVSGGTSTHLQERKQLYLQYLVLVTP
jgi:hypothetical protein